MLREQLLQLPLELTTRTKLKMKGILSLLPDGVREATAPNVRLTLVTRRNELPRPFEGNILRNRMILQPFKNVPNGRPNGILHRLGTRARNENRPSRIRMISIITRLSLETMKEIVDHWRNSLRDNNKSRELRPESMTDGTTNRAAENTIVDRTAVQLLQVYQDY